MIFWSGHGILIPIFGLIGLFGGTMVGGMLIRLMGASDSTAVGVGMICGGIGAAAMVWLYALTMGKTVEQTLLDPATRQPVILRRRHTFFFIPAFAWAVIASLGGLMFAGAGVIAWASGTVAKSGSESDEPGADGLRAAERLISSKDHGVAHGNTAEATRMAEQVSVLAKEFRNLAIEKGRKSTFSVSGGEFLTYCQVSEQGTAFILHVPDLRKFTSEAKEAMATMAWAAAQVAVSGQQPAARKLAVGLHGVLLYETILIGKPVADYDEKMQEEKVDAGILKRHGGTESEVLRPFFSSPALAVTLGEPGKKMDGKDSDSATSDKADGPAKPAAAAPGSEPAAAPQVATTPPPMPAAPPTVAAAPAATPPAAISLPTPVRDWKSADGRPLRASLVRFTDATGANAEFKREDGVAFTIAIEKFSAEDKAEMQRLFAESKGG